MSVSLETFRRVAIEDDECVWELHCGQLVRKPGMTLAHNRGTMALVRQLLPQVDEDRFDIRTNAEHIRIAAELRQIQARGKRPAAARDADRPDAVVLGRSEEHTSELQSL